MLKKFFLVFFSSIFLLFVIVILVLYIYARPQVPQGEEGARAEALSQKIEKAVHLDAWKQHTAALSFLFQGIDSGTRHFRDNRRGYREVSWKKGKTKYRVLYDQKARYLSYRNEELLQKKESEKAYALYQEAYKKHSNDFFWLNPFSQMRAPGARRFYVQERALLLHYESGGVTPGDSYLIITDAEGLPQRWQIWASILPLKGLEFTFENWQSSESKARFSLLRRHRLLDIQITDLKTYLRYPPPPQKGKESNDRFARLIKLTSLTHSPKPFD